MQSLQAKNKKIKWNCTKYNTLIYPLKYELRNIYKRQVSKSKGKRKNLRDKFQEERYGGDTAQIGWRYQGDPV
jgi:hypothetical protein